MNRDIQTFRRRTFSRYIASSSGSGKECVVGRASNAAYQSVPYLNVYAASKTFLLSFSRGLKHEFRFTNISVTCICPGPTDTDFINRARLGEKPQKMAAFARVLEFEDAKSAIVFCRTRTEVDQLTETLNARGYHAEALHGGLSQDQRDRVMKRFRAHTSELLIATDVAARGLDVQHVSHVVNFDVPMASEDYIHRVGRTGRGSEGGGRALLFLLDHELGFLRFLRQKKVRPNEYEFPVEKLAQINGFAALVWQFNANGIATGYDRNTGGNGTHRTGNVIGQTDNAGGLDTRCGFKLVKRNHWAGSDIDDFTPHAEII